MSNRTHHVLVEQSVLLLDAVPRLQSRRGIEGCPGLGASVGWDRLAGWQASLAEDQNVVAAAEGILRHEGLPKHETRNWCF